MSYEPAEYEVAKERGYVTPEDMERWTGTDRSTWWRRWWLSPDGFSRWSNFKARAELWVADHSLGNSHADAERCSDASWCGASTTSAGAS